MKLQGEDQIAKDTHFDVCIIGGGVNGAGIARDAAGRGLSVLLVEKDDLAQGTSSRSGKLVHGGLRYLEYMEFRLVRDALIEREVLLAAAPHIIWPMRFVLPHSPRDRPAWLVRLGLFLYDHLGGRKRLPGTRVLNLHTDPEGLPIKDEYRKGFEYSDCWVDDARLVILNALGAAEEGATVVTRTCCTSARRENSQWQIMLESGEQKTPLQVTATALVNAAGPWVDAVIDRVDGVSSKRRIRLVKGSHIVVKKFWDGEQAYLVQNDDKRVIFINPYENDHALIGTTDIPFEGRPEDVSVEQDEIDYLIRAVNTYFKTMLCSTDVVHSFSGVRPLYDDNAENPSAVTRDYLFDLDAPQDRCPLLSIYGGKITTYRKLAEKAVNKLSPFFSQKRAAWTATECLPGGDIETAQDGRYVENMKKAFHFLPTGLLDHYFRLYGTRTSELLNEVTQAEHLGQCFGGVFYEREAQFLIDREWACTEEDVLERRTKHGLHLSIDELSSFSHWFKQQQFVLPEAAQS